MKAKALMACAALACEFWLILDIDDFSKFSDSLASSRAKRDFDCEYALDTTDPKKEMYSIFRYTHYLPGLNPERVIRAWNANDPLKKPLRITYHNIGKYPFQSDVLDANTREVILGDIDGIIWSRFKVQSIVHKKEYINPVDDTPSTTLNKWTELVLLPPPLFNQTNPSAATDQWFITNSAAFTSTTNLICVDKTDGNLIEINEDDKTKRVLLDAKSKRLKIKRFGVSFYASKHTERIDLNAFFLFPNSNSEIRRCVNMVRFDIEVTTEDQTTSKLSNTYRKVILMENINNHRPFNCDP